MTAPTDRDFACAIIFDTRGRLLLQQRDNIPGIAFPGKIGLFGGDIEGDETFLECVVREVREEIGYDIPPERFEHLAICADGDDSCGTGSTTANSEYYVVKDVPVEAVTVTEGSLLIAMVEDLPFLEKNFVPPAYEAIRQLLRGPTI